MVRARAGPRAGHDQPGRAVRVRARDARAVRARGPADDPLRGPGRRREAEDPASADLPRAARLRREPHRRSGPRRPARPPRRRPRVRRPRRELSGRARRAARRRAAARRHPARGRRGQHGGSVREADGAAGSLPRHPRTGCHARERRRPHRVPGLHADARARRPGGARVRRPRGVPGARLPRGLRARGQVGDADRPRRPRA